MTRHTLSALLVAAMLTASGSVITMRAAPGDTPLADAARRGDAATVRTLIKSGAEVNSAGSDGMTPLHWAALHNQLEVVKLLVYSGANLGATTRLGGYTPLLLAAQNGHTDVIKALLAGGAPVDRGTSNGSTPLMLAAGAGKVAAVQALLDSGANVNAVELSKGETALMFAAAQGRPEVVRVLTARGANVQSTTTVIDLVQFSNLEQENEGRQNANSANARGKEKTAAEIEAEKKAKEEAAKKVPGVDRAYLFNELVGTQGGLTPLLFAARQGDIDSVAALLDAGAPINQPSAGDKTTPLLIATINGHFDLAMLLLDKGADPRLASDNGVTPLYAAINCQWAPRTLYPQPRAYLNQRTDYVKVMEAFLAHGADVNARVSRKVWYSGYNFDQSGVDETGATAFWRAAYGADITAMRMLVAHGADPNVWTKKAAGRVRTGDNRRESKDVSGLPPVPVGGPGVAPLLAAAGAGYGEGFAANAHRYAPTGMMAAVKYLVEELQADVKATDHEGHTALHHAAARGDNEMIRYLVSNGADVMAVNREGKTTVDMANGPVQRIQPYPETIALLEGLGAKNNHKCISC